MKIILSSFLYTTTFIIDELTALTIHSIISQSNLTLNQSI